MDALPCSVTCPSGSFSQHSLVTSPIDRQSVGRLLVPCIWVDRDGMVVCLFGYSMAVSGKKMNLLLLSESSKRRELEEDEKEVGSVLQCVIPVLPQSFQTRAYVHSV